MRETSSTDGHGWQWLKRGELKRESESFLCQLKNRLCKLMPSNTQFIRQVILDYEDFMTTLEPMCTGCCVKNIAYNTVTSGTHTQILARTHQNQSREIMNIKSFGISIFKQIMSYSPGYQTQFVSTSKRVSDYCLCNSWGPKYSHQITQKNDKYLVLIIELQKVWNVKVVVIPVVISAPRENR